MDWLMKIFHNADIPEPEETRVIENDLENLIVKY